MTFNFHYVFRVYSLASVSKFADLLKGIEYAYRPNSSRNASNPHFGSFYVEDTFKDDVKAVLDDAFVEHKVEELP